MTRTRKISYNSVLASGSGVKAAILIGDHEFPVRVDGALELGEGLAMRPSDIFVRTSDLRKDWPFDLIGWLSDVKKWMTNRNYRREKKHYKKLVEADEELILNLKNQIVGCQLRAFTKVKDVGYVMKLSEYIDMGDMLIKLSSQLAEAGAPMCWDEREGRFVHSKYAESPIWTIMKYILNALRAPVVRPWADKPHMRFAHWYGNLILKDNGYPTMDHPKYDVQDLPKAEEITDVDEGLEVDTQDEHTVVDLEPEVLKPGTANDEIGIHIVHPVDIEFKMQYTITVPGAADDIMNLIAKELNKLPQHTRFLRAVSGNQINIRYLERDVRTPVAVGTEMRIIQDFPNFVDSVIKLIKAYIDMSAAQKEMEEKIR